METGPVALVTGASSGIGQATAELLAARGFRVFGTSRAPDQVARSFAWLAMDVRSDASVDAAVRSLLEQAGRIDVLVNNAGYAQGGAIEETSVDEVRAQLDTNLLGVILVLQAVLPSMRRQGSGRIVNVGSVIGRVAPPYLGVYAASKFALEGLTEALREEVRPFGVDVSLVEPAYVRTNFASQVPATPIAAYAAAREAALRVIGAGVERGMDPEVVAKAILRAITTRSRLRHVVGSQATGLLLLHRLLPERIFDHVRRRVFGAPTTTDLRPTQQPL